MEFTELLQAGISPLLTIVIVLQWRIDNRIHAIDKRLVHLETLVKGKELEV